MARKANTKRDYDYHTLREERSYGFFWYDWVWRLIRSLLLGACCVLVVGGLLMSGWNYLSDRYIKPVDEGDPTVQTFTVASGSSLSRVSSDLEDAGLIRNRHVFKYLTDFMGLGQMIQTGEYELSPSMTLNEIIGQLSQGDGKPLTRNITIIPGWTIEDVADYFQTEGIAGRDEFLAIAKNPEAYAEYYYIGEMLKTANVSQRLYPLEGYLAPNTYEIYTSASLDSILRKLIAQTEVSFPSSYFDRADELEMTMDQVLTLASMIEKEAKNADFAKVSAVFHNRLKEGMKLQSDVTVKYVLGTARMYLTNDDLAVDSLYNTYQHAGLPLGPVCNPSPSAVTAALYPDEEYLALNYRYFSSQNPESGELVFARTLEEHNANVEQYRDLWIEYDRQRGVE